MGSLESEVLLGDDLRVVSVGVTQVDRSAKACVKPLRVFMASCVLVAYVVNFYQEG